MKTVALLLCLAAPLQAQGRPGVLIRDFLIQGIDGADTGTRRPVVDSLSAAVRAGLTADTAFTWLSIKDRVQFPDTGRAVLLGVIVRDGDLIAAWSVWQWENGIGYPHKDCARFPAGQVSRVSRIIVERALAALHTDQRTIVRPRPPQGCS